MRTADSSVEILDFDRFQAERSAWEELLLATALPLPFVSHTWLSTWWKHFGAGQRFAALVVRGESGGLDAALPLAIRRVRLAGLAVQVAEIVGTGPVPTRGMGLADKADALVRSERSGALEQLVLGLRERLPAVDLFDLKALPADGPLATLLTAGGALSLERSSSPYLRLGPWEDYLRSRSRNFRKHLKKYWRLLEQAGEVEIRLPRVDREPWSEDLLAVNRVSWKAERGTNLFRDPRVRAFLLELVPRMAADGDIDLRVLRVAERPVAYELCFDVGGRLFSYNSGYDGEFSRMSPGTVLTSEVIRAASEAGRIEYDLLRGDEEYKTRWSEQVRSERQILLPCTVRGRLYSRLGPRLKASLKRRPWIEELGDRLTGIAARLRHQ